MVLDRMARGRDTTIPSWDLDLRPVYLLTYTAPVVLTCSAGIDVPPFRTDPTLVEVVAELKSVPTT